MKKQSNYVIEITDTFAGEANYSWVKRFIVKASSIQGAITKLAKYQGDTGWRLQYGDNMNAKYNLTGACVCAFVDYLCEIGDEYELGYSATVI
jgi:hypothetical protein